MSQKKGKSSRKKSPNKGRKEKYLIAGMRSMFVLIAVLFVWSIWPLPVDSQTLRVNREYLAQAEGYACGLAAQLPDYAFDLQIPEKMWKLEDDYILLNLHKENDQASQGSGDPACSLTLEARLEADNLYVQTGSRIISTFIGAGSQAFMFTISPASMQPVSGRLWIAANVYDASGGLIDRIPLFIIPFEIEVVSMLGLSPIVARYVVFLVLLILLAIVLRRRLLALR